jgi:metallo-beta-lactamase class B
MMWGRTGRRLSRWAAGVALLVWASLALAQNTPVEWTTAITPFPIVDNLYYVGSRDLASYLIVTPKGNVLINSSLESSPALIRKSVEQLGFHWRDTRILLISHAHSDHDGGSAAIIRETGAQYMVMDGDVAVVESGGAMDFAYGRDHYPPAKVDRVLHDGSEVQLGRTVLVARRTAGHTRGCTTWTLQAHEHGKTLNVVIVGSWNVNPGFRLVDQSGKPASYPGIAADYQRTFTTLRGLRCDVFLGAHGSYFNMLAKLDRIKAGDKSDVWIDPQGYQDAVAERQRAYEMELSRQQSAPTP